MAYFYISNYLPYNSYYYLNECYQQSMTFDIDQQSCGNLGDDICQSQVFIPDTIDEPSTSILDKQKEKKQTFKIKTHSCNHCNRKFARKYDVIRHNRIHTGSKPYICPCCQKAFSRSDARIRHFRTEPNCQHGASLIKKKKTSAEK